MCCSGVRSFARPGTWHWVCGAALPRDRSSSPRVGCQQQGRASEETPSSGGSAWTCHPGFNIPAVEPSTITAQDLGVTQAPGPPVQDRAAPQGALQSTPKTRAAPQTPPQSIQARNRSLSVVHPSTCPHLIKQGAMMLHPLWRKNPFPPSPVRQQDHPRAGPQSQDPCTGGASISTPLPDQPPLTSQ